ncbi:MAG: lamin tail domain-containing protein [Myxococcota bacterium]
MPRSLVLLVPVGLAGCASDSKLDRLREAPVVSVVAPEEGEVFRRGEGDVVVVGEATDGLDDPGDLDAAFVVDGGSPVPVSLDADGLATLALADLDVGEHTVTFTVADSDGDVGEADVTFEVQGPLGPPTVTITEPADGATATLGETLAFRGEATDTTTPAGDLAFTWTSDLQGELQGAITGDGASALVTDALVAGTHVVTLAVVDGDGEVGTDAIAVTIEEEAVIAEPGDLVFSELMINPEVVEDEVGEWVELYNTGGASIDIAGYTFRDDDVDAWVLEGPIVVAGGDYVVLCANVDTAVNGGVPCDGVFFRDSTGNGLALANGPDEVVLARPDGVEIDWLHYDDTWIVPGVAIGVDPSHREAGDNDDRTHWCEQTTVTSSGGEPGTPGADNDACVEP